MARVANPYAGTYTPVRTSLSKEAFIKGLKGVPKTRAPNRKHSEQSYKSALPKISEGTAE
jgi:hypothetical protein